MAIKKRLLGRTGLRVYSLGFGLMRIPKGDEQWDIDETVRLIREASNIGINFFDTAQVYRNGLSERALGKAMKGNREKFIISTKTSWKYENIYYFPQMFEFSLQNLQTDFIDCYVVHSLTWEKYNERVKTSRGIWKYLLRYKNERTIRYIGFSSHDNPQNIIKLIKTDRFDFVILQYSFLDQKNKEVIELASDRNIGVIVMGPLAGGKIPSIGLRLSEKNYLVSRVSFADIALRFVLRNPQVAVCLSGMTNRTMLCQNFLTSRKNLSLTDAEKKYIKLMQNACEEIVNCYCTQCEYCMPCPNDVRIPEILTLYAYSKVLGNIPVAKERYRGLNQGNASNCKECGLCESRCPQNINITIILKEAHKWFTTILPPERE